MKNRIIALLLIYILCSGLVACGNTQDEVTSDITSDSRSYEEPTETESDHEDYVLSADNAQDIVFSEGAADGLLVQVYDRPMPEGYDYTVAGAEQNGLYFSKKEYVPMGVNVISTEIVKITDDQEEQLLTIKDDKAHWINEEKVHDNGVIWVLYDEGHSYIQMYDNELGKIITIREYVDGTQVVLNTSNDHITWATWERLDSSAGFNIFKGSLECYDVKLGTISTISDQVYASNPYSRFPIYDDKCSFIEYENGDKYLCIYDLQSKEYIDRVKLNIRDPNNCMLDGEWVVFSDGSYENNRSLDIYGYKYADGLFFILHSSGEGHSIFSFHLLDGWLIFSDDKNDSARLICRNLSTSVESLIVDNPGGYFTFGWSNANGYIVIEDIGAGKEYVLSNTSE